MTPQCPDHACAACAAARTARALAAVYAILEKPKAATADTVTAPVQHTHETAAG